VLLGATGLIHADETPTPSVNKMTYIAEPPEFSGRFGTHTSAHFRIYYDTHASAAVSRAELLERTYQRFYSAFGEGFNLRQVNEPLVCVLFGQSLDFERYAQTADRIDMSWSRGYYSSRTNRVAIFDEQTDRDARKPAQAGDHGKVRMNTALATTTKVSPSVQDAGSAQSLNLAKTTHEASHQLAFNSGLQSRGVMYPLWVSEGLATNFELDSDGGPFGPEFDNATRREKLTAANDTNQLFSLEELVTLARLPVGDANQVNIVYAQSWGLFKFLYAHRKAQLMIYLRLLASLPPGARSTAELRQEFVAAFGEPAALEACWRRFVVTLRQ